MSTVEDLDACAAAVSSAAGVPCVFDPSGPPAAAGGVSAFIGAPRLVWRDGICDRPAGVSAPIVVRAGGHSRDQVRALIAAVEAVAAAVESAYWTPTEAPPAQYGDDQLPAYEITIERGDI